MDSKITAPSVEAATNAYRAAEDVVGQFIDARTREEPGARTLMSSLYQAYTHWAEGQGIRKPLSATKLNQKLEDRGMQRGKIAGTRVWQDIELNPDEQGGAC